MRVLRVVTRLIPVVVGLMFLVQLISILIER